MPSQIAHHFSSRRRGHEICLHLGYDAIVKKPRRIAANTPSALFDPTSRYSQLRSGFDNQEKLHGYLRWLAQRRPSDRQSASGTIPQRMQESQTIQPVVLPATDGTMLDTPVTTTWNEESWHEGQSTRTKGRTYRLTIEGLRAYGGCACRVFLLDSEVLRLAEQTGTGIDWSDTRKGVAKLFADPWVRKDADIMRLVSAIPDLDGQVDQDGIVDIKITGPAGSPNPLDDSLVVIVIDGVHCPQPDLVQADQQWQQQGPSSEPATAANRSAGSAHREILSMQWTRQFEIESPRLRGLDARDSNPVLQDVYALFSLLAFEAATHAMQQLTDLLGTVAERFRASVAEVFTLCPDGRLNTLVMHNTGKPRIEASIEDPKGIVAHVARTRRGYCARDVSDGQDRLYREDVPETRSEIAVPIVDPNESDSEKRLLGVINLESRQINAFSPTQIDGLRAAAGALVPHLIVLSSLQHENEAWLPWHPDIHGWDLTVIFRKLCHTIAASLGSDSTKCSIWYVDRPKESLFVYATNGYDIEYMHDRALSLGSCTGRISNKPPGKVYVVDPLQDFVEREKAERMGLKEALLCPISRPNNSRSNHGISVLNVYFTETGKNRPDVCEALVKLADLIGAMTVTFDIQRKRIAGAQLHHLLREMPRSSESDFEVIRDLLKEVFAADGVSIFACDPEDRSLRCAATTGLCDGKDRNGTTDPRHVQYSLNSKSKKGFTISLVRHPGLPLRMNNVLDRGEKDLPDFLPPGPLLKYVENFAPREDKNRRLLAYGITVKTNDDKRNIGGMNSVGALRVLRRSGSKPFTICDEHLIAYLADRCRPAFSEWQRVQRGSHHGRIELDDSKFSKRTRAQTRETLKAFSRILRPIPVGRSTHTLIGELVRDLFTCYDSWHVSEASVFVRHGGPQSDCYRLHGYYTEPDATPPLNLVSGGMPPDDPFLSHRRTLHTSAVDRGRAPFAIATHTTLNDQQATSGIRVPIMAWSREGLIEAVLSLEFDRPCDWEAFLFDPLLYGVLRLAGIWNACNFNEDDLQTMLDLELGRASLTEGVARCQQYLQEQFHIPTEISWSDRLPPATWKPFSAMQDQELYLYGVMHNPAQNQFAIPLLIGTIPTAYCTIRPTSHPDTSTAAKLRVMLDTVTGLWMQLTSGRTDLSGQCDLRSVDLRSKSFETDAFRELACSFRWKDSAPKV